MVDTNEYKSVVGIESVHLALLSEDSSAVYTAGTPFYFAPTAKLSYKPKTSQEPQYADNIPFDIAYAEAESDGELEITNLPSELYALLFGSYFDAATGRASDRAGTPPYFALGFKSLKSNGSYLYRWYYKVQFSAPEENAESKADKATPQTIKLPYKASKTINQWADGDGIIDGHKRFMGDEDTLNFDPTGWFLQVQKYGATTPSALALSSSTPTDGADSVSKTDDFTMTFNNALDADAIYNVVLMDASLAIVTVTGTLDSTRKIMTVAHTAMAGSTAHTIVYSLKDIYGQALQGVIDFTTEA